MLHLSAGNNKLPPRESIAVPIDEPSRIGEARRAGVALAAALEFSETQQSNLAIVITEAANNVLRHAGRGEIVLRGVVQDGIVGVQVLALDKGPGILNLAQSLQDGYSTGGTSGTGMGAMQRLSGTFAVYSPPGLGTALLTTVWSKPGAGQATIEAIDIGIVNRAKPGEDVSGDSWAIVSDETRLSVLVVDGLGHGPDAARASHAAVSVFEQKGTDTPTCAVENLHATLRGTRGAAVAAVEIVPAAQTLTVAGVGNIAGLLVRPEKTQTMISHHGIVGYQVRKIQEFTYACPPGTVVLLSSDGIATLRTLGEYPNLFAQPAALIAGVLYRDFQRTNDDATLLVVKIPDGGLSA